MDDEIQESVTALGQVTDEQLLADYRQDEPLEKSLIEIEVPKGFALETRIAPNGDARQVVEDERKRAEKAMEEARKSRDKKGE